MDEPAAVQVRPRAPSFSARVGALLASPATALAAVDARRAGAISDAAVLVLLGTIAFRLDDLVRAGAGGGSALTVARQMLVVLGQEIRTAAVMVILGGLAVTVLAGKGRRDPGWDIELAAACFVPFFAGQALLRLLQLPALLGPMRLGASVLEGMALAWFAATLALSIRVARRRPIAPEAAAVPVRPRDRFAVAALAAALGGAAALSLAGVSRAGRDAPGFTLPRVDGQQGALALSALAGQVVLLDFWATWCGPCIQMFPTLHDLYGEFRGKGVEFVGINSDAPGAGPDEVRAFLANRPAPYPMVVDDGAVGALYKVVALPHLVVLGRDHTIRRVFWGITSRGELAAALEQASR